MASFWPGEEQVPPPPPEIVNANVVLSLPDPPVAVAVTEYEPAAVGVPDTVPVDEPMVTPRAGRSPTTCTNPTARPSA